MSSSSSSSAVNDYLRDEDLTQETRDLISSFPSEKGLLVSQLYQFQGRWHTQALLQGLLVCQKHFEAKYSDIILVTNPKSGTTWLKALVFSLINRHKFPVYAGGNHPLLVTNPHLLVPFLEGVYYESPDFDFSKLPPPRVMNTHIPLLSLPESVKSSSSVEAFCEGNFIGGPFRDHVLEYWYASLENPNKVLFVTYEGLKKQTGDTIKRIAEFLGCGFIGEEEVRGIVKLCSFESLSSLQVNREGKLPNGMETKAFFRKGDVGGWGDTLSESLAEKIDRTIEEKFRGSGLKFSC
ncbi:unnamed protein product [Eruca vesicaria subsp. sativa]|uniref:Sulfotransferase n=1 Tax=Eruca vesicaria subsp. sativa TaxID=29727 RepID=A0ABC8LBV6_ERUVS|nr:unnamed protein product [Eruca vesicaria subsp. sativa]